MLPSIKRDQIVALGFFFNRDAAPLSQRRHAKTESNHTKPNQNVWDSAWSNYCGLFLYVAICELLGVAGSTGKVL